MKNNSSNKRKIKTNKKYVTTNNDGIDFRKMSKIMSDAGYVMNHATCRTALILAIEMLITQVSKKLKVSVNKNIIKQFINNQNMQNNLSDVICSAYRELLKEEKDTKITRQRSK